MTRAQLMLSGAWPTLLALFLMTVFAVIAGADWPNIWYRSPSPPPIVNQSPWLDVLIFLLGASFLSIKSTIMLQRMGRPIDRLTVSLVATNYAFAALYIMAISRPMFGAFLAKHREFDEYTLLGLRVALLWTLMWGIWSLTNTRPVVIVQAGETVQWTGEQIGNDMTMTATVPNPEGEA